MGSLRKGALTAEYSLAGIRHKPLYSANKLLLLWAAFQLISRVDPNPTYSPFLSYKRACSGGAPHTRRGRPRPPPMRVGSGGDAVPGSWREPKSRRTWANSSQHGFFA